jgi:hypothetical protein
MPTPDFTDARQATLAAVLKVPNSGRSIPTVATRSTATGDPRQAGAADSATAALPRTEAGGYAKPLAGAEKRATALSD